MSSTSPPTHQTAPNPWRWLLLTFTIAYFTMSFVVRFVWPPVIPIAAPELGIAATGAGAYMTAFFIGYVITQIPGGMLGDKFGTRFVFCSALFIEGLGSFGVSISPNYITGFAFRILTGLGGGMVFASCVRYIVTIFPAKELGIAFGLMLMTPAGIGVIMPNLIMPWLLEMFSWRECFQVVGCASFTMAFIAFLIVRDAPNMKKEENLFNGLLTLIRKKNILLLGATGFWLIWITVGFVTWGNSHIQELKYTRLEASYIMMSFGFLGMLGSFLGGIFAPKAPSLRLGLMSAFIVMAPLTWMFSQAVTLTSLAIWAGALGFTIGFANPFTPLLTTKFAGKESLGTASGVTGCMYQFGAMVGPLVMGYSRDVTGGFAVAWLILTIVPVMGAFTLLFMQEKAE